MLGILDIKYVYVAVILGFSATLAFVKYQSTEIDSLNSKIAVISLENTSLTDKINQQNSELKAGEEKFLSTQRSLDVASGKNLALSKEYTSLRNSWKAEPPAKDCGGAMYELKNRIGELNKSWNE